MLIELITSQNKAFFSNLDPKDLVEPLLANLKQKVDISTGMLLLEGQERHLILLVFQNAVYAVYHLQDNEFKPISFSDYFDAMAKAYGMLHLYAISPVLFKALLVLAQEQPTMIVTSDMIDNERLLDNIKRDKKEAVMVLKNNQEITLFYFRDGMLRDAYLEGNAPTKKGADLRKTFLALTGFNTVPPAHVALYEHLTIRPAADQDEGEEHIASITPSDHALWTPVENPILATEDEEKEEQWAIEFLDGDQAGKVIDLVQKRVTVGRGMGDVRINDPQISRHHADLECSGDTLTISDQKSTNGVFVNEEKVIRIKLSADDIIRLGDTSIKVVYRE